MKAKLQRFEEAHLFSCPFCQKPLTLAENSLKCPEQHVFDLAKFGYVNLAPQAKQSKDYDKDNFLNRQVILEAGFYQHILNQILHILNTKSDCQTILDIGCGEGYYAREIQAYFDPKDIYAFDLSKSSIQIAAKKDSSLAVKWFVGDLSKLPIQSSSIDVILDIFSPAHYQEFQRVLKENGLLIKVIPNHQHLQEIRSKAARQLQKKDYSNQAILDHLEASFEIIETYDISAVYPISEREKEALLKMTPLLFHVDSRHMDWSDLTQITIAATIVTAKSKQNVSNKQSTVQN